MDKRDQKRTSKFLSLVLRHEPQTIGLELDPAGWVDVELLLAAMAAQGRPLSRETLERVVRENDKQRFALSNDGRRIRANQGHSIDIELGYQPAEPPATLWHGTSRQFVQSIRQQGIQKMQRHHVHLHEDQTIATAVGTRRGQAVLLEVNAAVMHQTGHAFFVTPNRVWLTEEVPPRYIVFPGVTAGD
ncbi:MAG: RNA 2'-phosphotransferase [Pirellulales bacterium]